MKIIKNKTHYTIKKGMGDVIVGEIIDYHDLKPTFYLKNDFSHGLEISDLQFILKELEKLKKAFHGGKE